MFKITEWIQPTCIFLTCFAYVYIRFLIDKCNFDRIVIVLVAYKGYIWQERVHRYGQGHNIYPFMPYRRTTPVRISVFVLYGTQPKQPKIESLYIKHKIHAFVHTPMCPIIMSFHYILID